MSKYNWIKAQYDLNYMLSNINAYYLLNEEAIGAPTEDFCLVRTSNNENEQVGFGFVSKEIRN